MKRLKLFLCLFVGLLSMMQSQTIEVLNKGEMYRPPFNDMVVMDRLTFGKYHYTAEKYDTLKKEVINLDNELNRRDSIEKDLIVNYEKDMTAKVKEIDVYKMGYQDMTEQLENSIEKNDRLVVDYKKLENRHRKAKKWRNIFMGTTGIGVGILVLLVAL